MTSTFALVTFAWIFFRAENIGNASDFISSLLHGLMLKQSYIETYNLIYWQIGMLIPIALLFLIVFEWNDRGKEHALSSLGKRSSLVRYALYYAIIVAILSAGGNNENFIYFQF